MWPLGAPCGHGMVPEYDIKLLVRWLGSYSVSINNSTERKIIHSLAILTGFLFSIVSIENLYLNYHSPNEKSAPSDSNIYLYILYVKRTPLDYQSSAKTPIL